jgi:hypothetical protein
MEKYSSEARELLSTMEQYDVKAGGDTIITISPTICTTVCGSCVGCTAECAVCVGCTTCTTRVMT